MSPRRRLCLEALWLLLGLGCSSTNTSALAPEAQTLVGVDPADFMAQGACGASLVRYVATLRDVTGANKITNVEVSASPFVVASSAPTPCDASVVFGNVVAYHAYEAELDGYASADLQPAYPGSSAMLLDAGYVAPRWTASCRGWTDGDGGTQPGYAYPNMTVTLRDCTPLGSPQ
jgi:hypothetical protein